MQFSWVAVRKLEMLVFAAMLIAVPWFAVRVLQSTYDQGPVRATTAALVNVLEHARHDAASSTEPITVESTKATASRPPGYIVRTGDFVNQEFFLSNNVEVVGSVTFDPGGMPKERSSFVVSRGSATGRVQINAQGEVSVN